MGPIGGRGPGCRPRAVGFTVSLIVCTLATAGAFAQWGERWGGDLFNDTGVVVREGDITKAGLAASDILPGNGTGFGYALRHGGVVPGSERVSVSGRPLVRQSDYTIDYGSGSILFLRPIKERESVQVTYRHDPSLVAQAAGTTLPLMAMNFGERGSVRGLFALNGVERLTDGGIRQRMSYGLSSDFSLSQGTSLKGIMFLSSQRGLRSYADPASPERGQGQRQPDILDRLVHQTFSLSEGGFHGGLTYTDVGSRFDGFEALQGQGYADDQLNKWKKERGITRLGYDFGYGIGGNDLSTVFNRISDGSGNIETRGFNLKAGGANLYWNSRWIDPEFTRFKDLTDGEAQQWAKERGISRDSMGGAFAFAGGSLKFDQNEIKDAGGAIHRRDFSLDTSLLKFNQYEQVIDGGFSRFNDLAEGERGQWGKERGWTRAGFSLRLADLYGREDTWNSYVEHRVRTDAGDLFRRSLNLTGVGWGVEWRNSAIDAGFGAVGSLRGDEIDSLVAEAHQSYGDTSQGKDDKKDILRQSGIERDYKKLSLAQGFGKLEFDMMSLDDAGGGIRRSRFGLDTGSLSFRYMDQEIDSGFSRMGDLLEFERKTYANEIGLHRREWSLGYAFGKNGGIRFTDLSVDGENGGLSRRTVGFQSGNYDLRATFRQVDESFDRAGDLADPEKKLLDELRGFTQWDFSGKMKLLSNLNAELFLFDAENGAKGIDRNQMRYFLNWAPDKLTSASYYNDRLRQQSAIESLNDFYHEKTVFSRSLGSFGAFTGYRERQYSGGVLSDGNEILTDYWKYEGAPVGGFKLLAERKNTRDTNGAFENIAVHGITGKVTPRMDVSFTEKTINRDEERAGEVHRTYAVGYDLGSGSKLGWQYTRLLTSAGDGKALQQWSLTQSALGNLRFSAAYVEDRLDGQNTKANAQFGIQTAKPFRLGPLSNATFSYNFAHQAQQTRLQQENKIMAFNADWGTNKIGFAYNGVMTGSGIRAVDRVYSFATNPDDKLPWHFSMNYKIRTLPGDVRQIIRTYHLDYKLGNRLTFIHDLNANPEKNAKDVPFGTVINPTGSSNWALDYAVNGLTNLKANYTTLYDDTKGKIARKGGLTLFGKSPSGNHIWDVGYSVDASTLYGASTIGHTFSVGYRFDVDPNNSVRLSLAHTQYEHNVPSGREHNWVTGSLDYTLRF